MKRKERFGSSDQDPKPTANNEQETTTEKGNLGRRGFLKIGAGAAALTLANPLESIAQRTASDPDPRTGECSDVPFTEPTKVDTDRDNVLRYELNAEGLRWTYVCGGLTKLGRQPVFNGALPGPSLYIDPGSTIELTLNNKLNGMPKFKGDDCPDGHHGDPTKPACFQHTNLHFHGLQVSPCSMNKAGKPQCGHYPIRTPSDELAFSSDDVLVDIFPGQKNRYKVVLPDMHAPGTNWYHSHLHGASAYQVSGGMAGALIIREPDESKIVRQDLDKVFLLQEILVNPYVIGGAGPDYPPIYSRVPTASGGAPQTETFVNGLCRPTLKMKKGQMMRWRFINAGVTPGALMTLRLIKTQTCSNTFPVGVVKREIKGEVMHLIAMDGLSFYGVNPQPVRYHLLGLGSRADFLVKFDQPGFYTLLKDSYPLESVTKPDSTTITRGTDPAFTKNPNTRQVLMFVYVEESSDYTDEIPRVIPGKKPDYLKAIWSVDKNDKGVDLKQTVEFQNPGGGKFQINGAPYSANGAINVKLDTAEEWTLKNVVNPPAGTGAPGQSNTHPFHVHLNPFQIVDLPFDFEVEEEDRQHFKYPIMERTNPDNWPFWDTIPLPGAARKTDGTVPTTELKIRTRFLIYGGEYVTHCHILVHEDVGMMINVKLNPEKPEDQIPPGQPVHKYPDATRKCIERTSRRTS